MLKSQHKHDIAVIQWNHNTNMIPKTGLSMLHYQEERGFILNREVPNNELYKNSLETFRYPAQGGILSIFSYYFHSTA